MLLFDKNSPLAKHLQETVLAHKLQTQSTRIRRANQASQVLRQLQDNRCIRRGQRLLHSKLFILVIDGIVHDG